MMDLESISDGLAVVRMTDADLIFALGVVGETSNLEFSVYTVKHLEGRFQEFVDLHTRLDITRQDLIEKGLAAISMRLSMSELRLIDRSIDLAVEFLGFEFPILVGFEEEEARTYQNVVRDMILRLS